MLLGLKRQTEPESQLMDTALQPLANGAAEESLRDRQSNVRQRRVCLSTVVCVFEHCSVRAVRPQIGSSLTFGWVSTEVSVSPQTLKTCRGWLQVS